MKFDCLPRYWNPVEDDLAHPIIEKKSLIERVYDFVWELLSESLAAEIPPDYPTKKTNSTGD